MQIVSSARRLSRVLRLSSTFSSSCRSLTPDVQIAESFDASSQWRNYSSFLRAKSRLFYGGKIPGNYLLMEQRSMYVLMLRSSFFTEGSTAEGASPTDAVKELYDKMLESVVVKRTMPPNAWLWSLIENCKSHEDIELLFDILQNLRKFGLSNLRIPSNFNCNLCREVTEACARVGAINFGKKALWKHNVYGLTPSVASAHHLLSLAEDHNDAKLMVEIVKLLKRNDLPLQPGTADVVFRICYKTDSWHLITKYSKRFIKAGIKLRKTTFDVWMEFAAKIGDVESLWKIEKLRSESWQQHTRTSAFSCAKGFLLEHKPEEGAAIIQVVNQALSDKQKSSFGVEIEKLVNEWPSEVIKRQKEEDRKANVLAAALKSDIPTMISGLLNMGLEVRKYGQPNW